MKSARPARDAFGKTLSGSVCRESSCHRDRLRWFEHRNGLFWGLAPTAFPLDISNPPTHSSKHLRRPRHGFAEELVEATVAQGMFEADVQELRRQLEHR